MNKTPIILLIALFLHSCSPKIRSSLTDTKFPQLEDTEQVFLLGREDDIPENSLFVGDLKIGDSGFTTDCGYETVIENAKLTAKKSGANLVQLVEIKKPGFESTCYRIKAKMYRNIQTEKLIDLINEDERRNKSRLPDSVNYSVVYFYRPKKFNGSLIGYKIKLNNDSIIGRVRSGEKFEYRTSNYGKHTFWGVTEAKDSVVINIKKGQEYFVKCGINMGIAIGRPDMYLIDNKIGIREYEQIK
ncbi:DUF2846 domain-containing protein [Aestuariibaculum sp. M13]|uniref:DUF2846 domain-containing protein n=1 Tax=Aestuariibaculum sp. M13 TaxID=2967132 RepID=UPI002159C91E|nr:DUF2846 domain-containing protein [Aestuariibaculum sp. M13]MCR8666516.1 DUF2846 domain-containing protein [Aestuariibaculum sp. M13]